MKLLVDEGLLSAIQMTWTYSAFLWLTVSF